MHIEGSRPRSSTIQNRLASVPAMFELDHHRAIGRAPDINPPTEPRDDDIRIPLDHRRILGNAP